MGCSSRRRRVPLRVASAGRRPRPGSRGGRRCAVVADCSPLPCCWSPEPPRRSSSTGAVGRGYADLHRGDPCDTGAAGRLGGGDAAAGVAAAVGGGQQRGAHRGAGFAGSLRGGHGAGVRRGRAGDAGRQRGEPGDGAVLFERERRRRPGHATCSTCRPGGVASCKVVALDPADSTSVLESNEVTFNGGVSDAFPPAILLAGRTHASSELRVEVVGVGLTGEVELAAPDGSWSLALERVDDGSRRLTALGRVAADLPDCEVRVGGSLGAVSSTALAPDTTSEVAYAPCVSTMWELDPTQVERIQPKDFAIVPSRDSVHVFYIRHDMNIVDPDLNEKTIGHKRSRDLDVWDPHGDTNTWIALQVRPGKWTTSTSGHRRSSGSRTTSPTGCSTRVWTPSIAYSASAWQPPLT